MAAPLSTTSATVTNFQIVISYGQCFGYGFGLDPNTDSDWIGIRIRTDPNTDSDWIRIQSGQTDPQGRREISLKDLYRKSVNQEKIVGSAANTDPGSGAFLTLGSEIWNRFFSGSRIPDPNPIFLRS
jgi:hypothetical protein